MTLEAWGAAAASAFGYPPPSQGWARRARERLGDGLLEQLDPGVADGRLVVDGYRFTLPLLGAGKGPYAWFSRSDRGEPAPNWEYFVQVAIWLEVREALPPEVVVGFEDELMDVSVRRPDGGVDWCIEVKERPAQLQPLLDALVRHATAVDLELPDRGNDPLRKAKYLVRQRPRWFSLAALGVRQDFAVTATGDSSFRLDLEAVPLERVGRV